MHRQSITPETLEILIRRSDLKKIPSALRPEHAKKIVDEAWALNQNLIETYPLKKWMLWGKPHFAPKEISTELLFRHIAKNMRYSLDVQTGRNNIVENLKHLLSEGVPYRLYRLDIKNFYESLDISEARSLVWNHEKYSPRTKALCDSILHHQKIIGECGLPRGIAISAILSDLMLKDFDVQMKCNKDVYFYARFVDDIVILTSSKEKTGFFMADLKAALPTGLSLNKSKCYIKYLPRAVKSSTPIPVLDAEYLGYKFAVCNPSSASSERMVSCTIADKKLKKIKTRIIRALLDYKVNRKQGLLIDRIKFLTSNFQVFNENSNQTNMAGIYFNYPLINSGDEGLKSLDKFLRVAVLSPKIGSGKGVVVDLENSLRKKLLKFSFEKGHANQVFSHFTGNRLNLIGKCWKY